MRHFFNHICVLSRLAYKSLVAISGLPCEAKIAVSSVYVAINDSFEIGRSAVYNRYSNGPKTLSWRTPDSMKHSSFLTSCSLIRICSQNSFSRWQKLLERLAFSLYKRPVWVKTLSKAWVISRKTAEQYFLSSKFFYILIHILCICSRVEYIPRNQNWWFG